MTPNDTSTTDWSYLYSWREPSKYKDYHAVAVLPEDLIVEHVTYYLAPHFSQFLRREVDKGAGYGPESPCV